MSLGKGYLNRYAKYKELLDSTKEDFDSTIYYNKRLYLYKKTTRDLAKVFAGTNNDIKGLKKEVNAWYKQKFELYKLSGTINTGDLFDDGTDEPVTLPTIPLRQRIRGIVEDLKTAHRAWKHQKPGNEGAPPEEATTRNPRPNSRYSFRDVPDDGLVPVEPPSSEEDGSRLETRALSPTVNKGQASLQGLPPQIGAVAPEELMPRRKRGRVPSGFSRGLETAKRLRDRVRMESTAKLVATASDHRTVRILGRRILYLNDDDGEDDDDWTDAQEETFLYDKCCDLYDAEAMVYNTLCSLQGTSLPEILGTVSLQTYITDDPEAQKYLEIRGVLLEDCDRFSLDKLADNAPTGCWRRICDDAVSIVNSISDHGILHKDVNRELCGQKDFMKR
ncbi:hypothetical protein BGZ57DRAFT_982484 [Hyaloscypha finlandica]|nr:hypothetical protein BGZ57DRAFT_982484 [Hyaloscypha finlandica]